MSRLSKLIEELCPEGVEWKKLGDIVDILRGRRLTKKELTDNAEYPVYHGGIEPIGYYTQNNRPANTVMIINVGASAGTIGYCDKPFWSSDGCYCIGKTDILIDRYLYSLLSQNQLAFVSKVRHAGIPTLDSKVIANFEIPVPPLPVQEEIVRILDKFTTLEAELEAELEARRKQYEYYRNELLTFNKVGGIRFDVKWVTLGEIAEIGTGSSNTNEELEEGKYPFFVRSQVVRYKNEYEYDETAIITSGDGVGVGKVFHYIEGKYALHQRAYRIKINDGNLNSKFFYYYMRTTFYNYIMKNAYSSSVTSVRRPMLIKFPVPLPPLSEQQRIVSILDRFEALTTDLQSGLPAEIEARRKQYEYYRDQLLTFLKKVVETTNNIQL